MVFNNQYNILQGTEIMCNGRLFKFNDKSFLWFIFIFIYLAYLNPEIGAKGGTYYFTNSFFNLEMVSDLKCY